MVPLPHLEWDSSHIAVLDQYFLFYTVPDVPYCRDKEV